MADAIRRSVSTISVFSLVNHDWEYGKKTIGFFGGFCLMLNNAIGAGVAAVPLIFVQGGFAPCICAMLLLGFLGAIAGGMVCEAMRHVPGNEHFRGRIEYARCVYFYMGSGWYYVTVIFLILALLTMNVAAIIISAQGVDQALGSFQGKTCGLELSSFKIVCVEGSTSNSPFNSIVISGGYALCLVVAIPLGILNLDDNILVQIISAGLSLFCIGYWMYELVPRADFDTYFQDYVWGEDYRQIVGSVMSNFAFVITVPSWCNEKMPNVSVNKTVWSSVVFCILCYGILGTLAAATFTTQLTNNSDFLTLLNNRKDVSRLTSLTCQFFPMLTALTGVPVCSIIMRYNLLQSKIVSSARMANLFAVGLPWAISIPLQTSRGGAGLQDLLNWGSLLFASMCNFVIPFLLYIAYRQAKSRNLIHNIPLLLSSYDQEQLQNNQHWALPGNQERKSKSHFAMVIAISMVILIAVSIKFQ